MTSTTSSVLPETTGLEVADLKVGYLDRCVLNGIGFRLDPGDLVALIGRNGSGKTTLLHALTGYCPASGRILWDGAPIATLSPASLAQRVALVDPSVAPPFAITVRDFVALGRSPHLGLFGVLDNDDEARVDAALAGCALTHLAGRWFAELSQGEQQRVRVAMAIASSPRYLLLDEPMSHLDPSHQRELLLTLRSMARFGGTGILAVMHDMNLAARFDRLLLLDGGRIVAAGSPDAVLQAEILAPVYGTGVFDIQRSGSAIHCQIAVPDTTDAPTRS